MQTIKKDKYIDGEYTVVAVTIAHITKPARYKTADWSSDYNDKYRCTRAVYEQRLYESLTKLILSELMPPANDTEEEVQ